MSDAEPEEWSPEGLCEQFWDVDRKMHDRRFAFILGAGASVQSGIPAAGALVWRWLGELHRRLARGGLPLERWATPEALGIPGFSFERAASFYSQVFARRFRQQPDEGYADLEDIMQGKDPSFGYSVLAHVLAETRHKLVITTNFDNLVSEALSIFTGTAPLVCGHESLANFIRVVPRRPVIVKIHRDLLMAPMNHADEIAALQAAWIEPLTRVFAAYTPVVIGYGGNDGSLMGFLNGLPMGAIPGGIFWCYYGPAGPPAREIRELVARHRGALVPIEGFDELMLRLSARLRIPLLDQVIESKARTRVDNYRRRVEELRARLFPPAPVEAEDEGPAPEPETPAAEEPVPSASHSPLPPDGPQAGAARSSAPVSSVRRSDPRARLPALEAAHRPPLNRVSSDISLDPPPLSPGAEAAHRPPLESVSSDISLSPPPLSSEAEATRRPSPDPVLSARSAPPPPPPLLVEDARELSPAPAPSRLATTRGGEVAGRSSASSVLSSRSPAERPGEARRTGQPGPGVPLHPSAAPTGSGTPTEERTTARSDEPPSGAADDESLDMSLETDHEPAAQDAGPTRREAPAGERPLARDGDDAIEMSGKTAQGGTLAADLLHTSGPFIGQSRSLGDRSTDWGLPQGPGDDATKFGPLYAAGPFAGLPRSLNLEGSNDPQASDPTLSSGGMLRAAFQQVAGDAHSSWPVLMQARAEPDRGRALRVLREGLVRFPNDNRLLLGLAERLGDVPSSDSIRAAISALETALEADPDDEAALRHLALLRACQRDFAAAEAALRRAWSRLVGALRRRSMHLPRLVVRRLLLHAFVSGLLARLQGRDDTRALAVLRATTRLGNGRDGGPDELEFSHGLAAELIARLDAPDYQLYTSLLLLLHGKLTPERVASRHLRFDAVTPASLAALEQLESL